MFDWIGDALSWVGDKFSDVGTAISEAVWDVMLEWLFNTIYGAVAEFFGMMNGMGADIFSQSWVSAFFAAVFPVWLDAVCRRAGSCSI